MATRHLLVSALAAGAALSVSSLAMATDQGSNYQAMNMERHRCLHVAARALEHNGFAPAKGSSNWAMAGYKDNDAEVANIFCISDYNIIVINVVSNRGQGGDFASDLMRAFEWAKDRD